MKRIHFEHNRGWFWITIITITLICILGGGLELFPFENSAINRGISAIGYFLLTIYFGKMVWFKNYVLWNKNSAHIRLNTDKEKTIRFDHILKITVIKQQSLIITKTTGAQQVFDVKGIQDIDIERLCAIIQKNSNAVQMD